MPSQNRIKLNKSDAIFLYAENKKSNEIAQKLIDKNYNFKGYIDIRYSKPECKDGILRCDLDHFLSLNLIDSVCIICIRDGSKHYEIAKKLYDNGITKIIFCPLAKGIPMNIESEMRLQLNNVESGEFGRIHFVPSVFDYNDYVRIISQNKQTVVFWCPISFVYTHPLEMIRSATKARNLINAGMWDEYIDVPIKESKPHINLYKHLGGEKVDVDEYLAFSRNTQSEREDLYNNRKNLFDIYEYEFIYNMNFFTESPAIVKYNKKGYFNVLDGTHRSTYLIFKGLECVPVRCSKEDFNMFMEKLRG